MSEPRKAIVTGAGSGVGRSSAIKLAQKGWQVAIVGRNLETLETTIQEANEAADNLVPFKCDVGRSEQVSATAKAILEKFKNIDALINSAGFNVPDRSFEILKHEDFERIVDVNLNGTHYFVSEILPNMRANKSGTIVNIVSDAGITAYPKSGPSYVASKFGQRGLTMSINAEERSNGIRACCVCPGDIATKFLDQRPTPPDEDARLKMLSPDDVANCALFAVEMPTNASIDEIIVRPSGKPMEA